MTHFKAMTHLKLALFSLLIGTIALAVLPNLALSATKSSKHDPKQPVEIVADALEVQQNDQIAVFSGNVEATQANLKLNTARLTVHYAAGTKQASAESNEIDKLEAEGGVVMSRPGEDATGDWAVYDVKGRMLTMGGNVVLTRDGNIVRGARLTLDLESGISRIDGGVAGAQNNAPAKGRVRSLFTPAEKNK